MSYIIAIGAYLFLLMIYGLVIAHKKVKTADDMVTGGHRIPFIILVGGLATIVWTLMGTPYGIQCAIVAVPASVIAILVVSAVTPKGEAARSLDALYQEK